VSSPSDLFARAWQHHQAQQYQEAEQLYRQVLQAEPRNADAWCFLGAALQSLGQAEEAAASYRQALELVPDYISALNCLGILLAQQGKLEEAAGTFERLLGFQPQEPDAWNNLGLVRLQQGHLDDAIACYQRALHARPDFAAARTNLSHALQHRPVPPAPAPSPVTPADQERVRSYLRQGIALGEQGRLDEGAAAFSEALRLQPDSVDAHNNLGSIRFAQRRLDEAIACYERVLHINPRHAAALYNLGVALEHQGRFQEAGVHYEQALQVDPQHADAWNNLGNVRKARRDLDGAIACYEQALRLKPDLAEIYINLGIVYGEREDWQQAEANLSLAQRQRPGNPEIPNGLGIVLAQQGRSEEAMQYFHKALELNPKFADVYNNMGIALKNQGKYAEAIASYQRALELSPSSPDAHTNWGNALQEQGILQEALGHYDRALKMAHDPPDSHFNRAILWLLQGDWERGWPEYEWRWQTKGFPHYGFRQPRWDGSDLTGKTIFLYAEQGLGDTLHFIRYVPLVKERGGRVIVQCQPVLQRLLANLAGIDQLIPQGSPVPEFDVHAALLSLPAIFKTTFANVPAQVPYLHPDPELVKHWRQELGAGDFKIGIVWQGNPKFGYDKLRSLALTEFAPLAQMPGVKLIGLQKGKGSEQIASLEGRFSVMDLSARLDEASGPFMDTAAVIKNLDLVIAPDTAIGHLAGALGARVWIALQTVPNWRWMLERTDSPWYPTARLFRQKEVGNWKGVFAEMASALRELLPKAT
jgi:tetratricopeptide (TPR) repeat protein